jgi:hypothetical protein
MPKSPIWSQNFKHSFAEALGQPRDSKVIREFIYWLSRCISYRFIRHKLKIYLTRRIRREEEILAGARIARTSAYLSTRTYEGRPLFPAIVVAERWALEPAHPALSPPWIVKFPNPRAFDLSIPNQTEQISQLADASSSVVVVDTIGKAWGIAISSNLSIESLSFDLGGYAFVANRHRRINFISCGDCRCYYDGFDWKEGKETEGLEGLGIWIATFDTSAEEGNFHLSTSFEDIIEELSYKGLSSIIAVCTPEDFWKLRDSEVIRPLRPDLEGLRWEIFDIPPRGLFNIFRLDGIHFVSQEIHVLAVCQKLSVRNGSAGDIGTGRGAARVLSKLLGPKAAVIKVSADSLITIFKDGEVVDSMTGFY